MVSREVHTHWHGRYANAARQFFRLPRPNLSVPHWTNDLSIWVWLKLHNLCTPICVSAICCDCTHFAGANVWFWWGLKWQASVLWEGQRYGFTQVPSLSFGTNYHFSEEWSTLAWSPICHHNVHKILPLFLRVMRAEMSKPDCPYSMWYFMLILE